METEPAAARSRRARRFLARPELAAALGAAVLWIFFTIQAGDPFLSRAGTAAYLNAAAPLGQCPS
jgi:hypothetical protein